MTFDEFRYDFVRFLEDASVNLGRKTAKTRQLFLDKARVKLDAFGDNFLIAETCDVDEEKPLTPKSKLMSDSVLCIKPIDKRRALDIGKGVHGMTSSESMRADEELNRSPFGDNKGKKEKKNE